MTDITTLSDRELLELAAKFCGIPGEYFGWEVTGEVGIWDQEIDGYLWNPLQNAGDRARACDEHGIAVIPWGTCVIAKVQNQSGKGYVFHEEVYSFHPNRTVAANYAATRLMAKMQLAKEKKNVHNS